MTPRRFARLSAILDRRQPGLTVLMDDLSKAHNVSAIIRTCDAVGVGEIHGLTDEVSFRAKITSAAGSDRFVGVRLHESHGAAIDHLRGKGFEIWAAHLDDRAVDFRRVDFTTPTCIVLGQEGPGVSPDLLRRCDGTMIIPMAGAVASLNVSVAAAVILFEAQRQRQSAGLYDKPQIGAEERQRLLFEWGYKRLARWCRERDHPYPILNDEGRIISDLPRGRDLDSKPQPRIETLPSALHSPESPP